MKLEWIPISALAAFFVSGVEKGGGVGGVRVHKAIVSSFEMPLLWRARQEWMLRCAGEGNMCVDVCGGETE